VKKTHYLKENLPFDAPMLAAWQLITFLSHVLIKYLISINYKIFSNKSLPSNECLQWTSGGIYPLKFRMKFRIG